VSRPTSEPQGITPVFPLASIGQVALVVRDIEATMRAYWEMLRVGPWDIWTYDPSFVKDMTYRGRPAEYSMLVALARVAATTVELIQPLRGPSIYTEHLERKGEGLHHVAVIVPSLDAAVADARARGLTVLQSGRGYGVHGDGGFAYFDTEEQLGLLVEALEIPRERLPPQRRFPG
jgi:methylmalonyl-CoA/ethylmalonyl-CoA epimerase